MVAGVADAGRQKEASATGKLLAVSSCRSSKKEYFEVYSIENQRAKSVHCAHPLEF